MATTATLPAVAPITTSASAIDLQVLNASDIVRLESEITHPMLKMQNEQANAVYRQVEEYYNAHFSGFQASVDAMAIFSTGLKVRITGLQSQSVQIPSVEELTSKDIESRTKYFTYKDTSLEVSEFVKNLLQKTDFLKPIARTVHELDLYSIENPVFRKQIEILDTLAAVREKAARHLWGHSNALYTQMQQDLSKLHNRVGTYNKLVQNGGKPIGVVFGFYPYNVTRPKLDNDKVKGVESSLSSGSAVPVSESSASSSSVSTSPAGEAAVPAGGSSSPSALHRSVPLPSTPPPATTPALNRTADEGSIPESTVSTDGSLMRMPPPSSAKPSLNGANEEGFSGQSAPLPPASARPKQPVTSTFVSKRWHVLAPTTSVSSSSATSTQSSTLPSLSSILTVKPVVINSTPGTSSQIVVSGAK